MQKLIFGHRGAPKLAHENTLESFRKAVELGADGLELDVRKTKDNVLVCFHDAAIDGELISALSFEQLNGVARTKNFVVPTLEEVLQTFAGKVLWQIEIKAQGYEYETVEAGLKYLVLSDFVIISFKFGVLRKIKARYPQVKLSQTLGHGWDQLSGLLYFLFHRKQILEAANEFSMSKILMLLGFAKLIPKNYPITVWTVDKPARIERFFKDDRVAAVTTNVPDVAIKIKNNLPH